MKLNMKLSEKGIGVRLSVLSSAISLVCLIGYCIYGAVFDYFDTVVFLGFAAGILLAFGYAIIGQRRSFLLNLLSVICTSMALGLFFLNSFPVWADNLNGITMYASRGGLAPVIAIMAAALLCIVLEIISCFMAQGKGENL